MLTFHPERFDHPEACGTCGGRRGGWRCAACGDRRVACDACEAEAPCGHAARTLPSLTDLVEMGLVPRENADAAVLTAVQLWGVALMAVAIPAGLVIETDIQEYYVPWWLLAGLAAVIVPLGWRAWPRMLRDHRAVALVAGLALLEVGLTYLFVTNGEGPGAHLRGAWRWWVAYALPLALAAAFHWSPWLLPGWASPRVREARIARDAAIDRKWDRFLGS